jgi:IS30 family transposase
MAVTGTHLRNEEVIELRRRYARGEQTRYLAASYGRSTSTIRDIVSGRAYRTVPGAVATRPGGNPGSLHHSAKLKDADVRAIRKLSRQGMSQRLIAERFGVSGAFISMILAGKRWSHVR